MLLRKGDRSVFKDIFDRYYMVLKGFSTHFIQDTSICDDIIQDTFLALYNSRKKMRSMGAVKSFLYASVKNACLNYLRREKMKSVHHESIAHLSSSSYTDQYIIKDVQTELYKAIKDLTIRQREVVVRSMNGANNEEIAEELCITVNTVKTLKKRAYVELRHQLKGLQWIMLLLLLY